MGMAPTRRQLLGGAVGASAAWLLGCSERGSQVFAGEVPDAMPPSCTDDLFARGTLVDVVPFASAGTALLDTPLSAGLDGRLYTDLEKLPLHTTTIHNDHFYIRTRYPDLLDSAAPWVVRIGGLVDAPTELGIASLLAHERPLGVHLMECSGNGDFARFGMLSAAEWSGVPLAELVAEQVRALPSATRVRVSGNDDHSQPSANSTRGASWVFSFEELARTKAFLATAMNGVPLPPDHGAPVRLLVPGWYGCTCIKWVDAIDLVGDAEPATSQMIEFASRTMQDGTPALARDYRAASIDQAAMPVRVERWNVDGAIVHRIVGVMWGGSTPTDGLAIRIDNGAPERVRVCPPQATNATWTWWTHAWRPPHPGSYAMNMLVLGSKSPTRRLDSGFYARRITI